MKHLKMLGLAVVAAAALTAFLGANSASATVLCTEAKTPCPGDKKISPVNDKWLHAILEKIRPEEALPTAYLLTTSGSGSTTAEPLVKCTESTVTAESVDVGSATETAKSTVAAANLTFGGCTPPGVKTLVGGMLEAHWIEGTDNGTVTSKEVEVTVTIFGVSCTYGSGTGTDLGTLTGGAPATVDINAVVHKITGGFLCPTTAIWEAKYSITEPSPLYVVKE